MKRANGTGSVTRLRGNRRKKYAVRVSYPDPQREGKRKQKYIGYFRTQAEAQAFLEQYEREELPNLASTLEDVWNDFQRSTRFQELSDSAKKTHRVAWARLSALGSRPVASIKRPDLQRIIDGAVSEGLAPGTVSKIKILMGVLFKRALDDDLIDKDPSAAVETPKLVPVVEKGVLTPATIDALWRMSDSPFVQSVLVLTYTGFRINELLMLTADSYHTDPVPHLIGGEKTEAGIDRPVPVHPCIQPIVEARLEKKGRLFDEYKSGKSYWKAFKKLMKELGQPNASPHWCRYTLTSMMEMSGANRLATDRITGHSDKGMTDHYTRLTVEFLYGEICKIVAHPDTDSGTQEP